MDGEVSCGGLPLRLGVSRIPQEGVPLLFFPGIGSSERDDIIDVIAPLWAEGRRDAEGAFQREQIGRG